MRLYPEDIAVFFDLIPIGTKVTVVNQPYVFGWRDGTLYLQAYAVMEDDSRDWDKNRKRLLAKLLDPKRSQRDRGARQGYRLAAGRGSGALAACAMPVPVTGGQTGSSGAGAIHAGARTPCRRGRTGTAKTGLLDRRKNLQ